jgi:hypothetical protein
MKTVINFPASTTLKPCQALESAKNLEWNDVIIIGYDKDGTLQIRSSMLTCSDAVFLLEKAKLYALSGGKEL